MFDYIKGMLAEKTPTSVTVEAGGIGYFIQIPLSTYEKLPELNCEVKLFTHHYVREDAHRLFGFYYLAERELFRLLLGINMIGPKVALAVLSGISPEALAQDIRCSNTTRLKSIPGIGHKTAERLMMELKGKIDTLIFNEQLESKRGKEATVPLVANDARNEAFNAMLSLGYTDKQIEKAFARVAGIVKPDAPVEEWIKKSLQVI